MDDNDARARVNDNTERNSIEEYDMRMIVFGLGCRSYIPMVTPLSYIIKPHGACSIAGHTPVATRTETYATDFRTIGQAASLELLREETTAEGG